MGYVQKLRDEVNMVRNITIFLEKEEAKEQLRKEQAMKVRKVESVQTSS
jgi:hypothetical protein